MNTILHAYLNALHLVYMVTPHIYYLHCSNRRLPANEINRCIIHPTLSHTLSAYLSINSLIPKCRTLDLIKV